MRSIEAVNTIPVQLTGMLASRTSARLHINRLEERIKRLETTPPAGSGGKIIDSRTLTSRTGPETITRNQRQYEMT